MTAADTTAARCRKRFCQTWLVDLAGRRARQLVCGIEPESRWHLVARQPLAAEGDDRHGIGCPAGLWLDRGGDDLEAQEGQRPIAIHALENLAHSDTGIVMLRRLLREQLQRVEQGLDPINVMRDPMANKRIPTGAWNTVLSPAEAAALSYTEDL